MLNKKLVDEIKWSFNFDRIFYNLFISFRRKTKKNNLIMQIFLKK
jgi:hypothetical protein